MRRGEYMRRGWRHNSLAIPLENIVSIREHCGKKDTQFEVFPVRNHALDF